MADCEESAGSLIILIAKGLDVKVEILKIDRLGSFCILRMGWKGKSFILVNVYFPTSCRDLAQVQTLEKLDNELTEFLGEDLYIMGDFNTVLEPDLGRVSSAHRPARNSLYRANLKDFLGRYSLSDVWREFNPEKKAFTWYRGGKASW